jgi:hypothetical protein
VAIVAIIWALVTLVFSIFAVIEAI